MPQEPDIEECELIEEHDRETDPGMDNGYSIALYRTSEGKLFIHIVQSDMSSKYDGSLGFDQWVSDAQKDNWKNL